MALALLSSVGPARAVVPEDTVIRLDRICRLDRLSRALWPGWKISDTAVILYDSQGSCCLLNHPDPPDGFERGMTRSPYRRSFHSAPAASVHLAPDSGALGGVPTAFVPWQRFLDEAVPAVFEEAFRVHVAEKCPGLTAPVDLVEGYPITAENLALSDIECELLARALLAPSDSLGRWTREFVAVRTFRRIGLGSPMAEAHERRLEFAHGLAAYVGERCRGEARGRLDRKDADFLAGCFGTPTPPGVCSGPVDDLNWYRTERYRRSGAALCVLLDRVLPGWREEASGACREPYEILWQLTRTELPSALEVLRAHDYAARVEERAVFVDGMKTDAERFFERVVTGGGQMIAVDTRLLASSSVSYDPENIERVDEHRLVHKRIIKIEYSGGTRVHVTGRPVAVFVGDDEFDIARLVMKAPGQYRVTVGGEPLEMTPGVHHADEPLSVSGPGLLIEARSGVIMVGENKVTFVLHR
jgi:hypothetical protein